MSCTFYCYKGGLFSGDYWCKKDNKSVSSDIYYRYCRDYNYDECPIYHHEESSGCFITTVACQILGEKDDSKLLNDFRQFRDNILQKDEKYYDILKEYDVIGPIVADCLVNDKNKQEMARGLYNYALIPIWNLIKQSNYKEAVEKYYQMTLLLVNYYGLKHEYNQTKNAGYDYENFVPSLSGHGRKLKKEQNNM